MIDVNVVTPESTRIGWIGTGVMGSSMCGHLLAAGYAVTVSTRTRSKAEALLAAGATWADSPAEVASSSDVIVTMVGYPADVRDVILGNQGALGAARPGAVLVDMSTSEPTLAVEIAQRAAVTGVHALDAPVSGGDVGARNATLSIMVGGPADVFEAVRPCLDVMGSTIVLQGAHGAGQHTKMMNQVLIASNMVGVCEALLYAYRANLDLDTVLASVSGGAAGSWSLSNLAPRMIAGNMAPGFYVNHFVKDMGIALAEAERMRLALPGLALAHQLYVSVQAQGGGSDGTQSLVRALAALSGLDWERRTEA
jgi:3-hydroxyisobutyrate dehydrogenase